MCSIASLFQRAPVQMLNTTSTPAPLSCPPLSLHGFQCFDPSSSSQDLSCTIQCLLTHKAVCVQPTTSEWFVLCQTSGLQFAPATAQETLTPFHYSPVKDGNLEIFCEKAVYCSTTPPGHHALQPGPQDACGGRTTTHAAVTVCGCWRHPNASWVWKPVCCCWHREGEGGRWKLLQKMKQSFFLVERCSCLPGDGEEVVFAWTRTWSWVWLNSSGLPAWRWPGFSCSFLNFPQGHSPNLPFSPSPSGLCPEDLDTKDEFPIVVLYCKSPFMCAQRNQAFLFDWMHRKIPGTCF